MKTFAKLATIALAAFLQVLVAGAAPQDTTFTLRHEFSGPDGNSPTWAIQTRDGSIWGVTNLPNPGRLYRIDPAGNLSVVHTFTDQPDGSGPRMLIEAADGSIYGVTQYGGADSKGTIYRVDPAGNYSVIYSFTGFATDGIAPNFLLQANDGFIYGTTGLGTLFRIDANGNFLRLHLFIPDVDGAIPNSIVQASDGLLYGTCRQDGPFGTGHGRGTFWRSDLAGNVTLLHVFGPTTVGGGQPTEPVGIVQAHDGLFYGAANRGGAHSNGALFRLDAAGNLTVIHSHDQNASDGARPETNFILGPDGRFYGTTVGGGLPITDNRRAGVIYRADTAGTVEVLHTFTGLDGLNPSAPPFFGAGGTLYATATGGGSFSDGVLGSLQLAPPLQIVSAASRKVHGSAGTFDLDLPLNGNPGIEPRATGSGGSDSLVFTFSNPLASASASISSGRASISSSPALNGTTLTVNLSGVVDGDTITVQLSNVADSTGQTLPTLSVSLRALLGDVNGNGVVNASDVSQVKAAAGGTLGATNFRTDITVNGSINSSDVAAVKAAVGAVGAAAAASR